MAVFLNTSIIVLKIVASQSQRGRSESLSRSGSGVRVVTAAKPVRWYGYCGRSARRCAAAAATGTADWPRRNRGVVAGTPHRTLRSSPRVAPRTPIGSRHPATTARRTAAHAHTHSTHTETDAHLSPVHGRATPLSTRSLSRARTPTSVGAPCGVRQLRSPSSSRRLLPRLPLARLTSFFAAHYLPLLAKRLVRPRRMKGKALERALIPALPTVAPPPSFTKLCREERVALPKPLLLLRAEAHRLAAWTRARAQSGRGGASEEGVASK